MATSRKRDTALETSAPADLPIAGVAGGLVVEAGDFPPNVVALDPSGTYLALGGYGWGKVLRADDGALLWEGYLASEDADDEDAGVVCVAAVSRSGAWAVFATDFHTGATGSRGLFVADVAKGTVAELDADVGDSVVGARFSADDRRALVHMSSKLTAFDLATTAEVGLLPGDAETKPRVTTGAWPARLESGEPLCLLAISDDGTRIAVGEDGMLDDGMLDELYVLPMAPAPATVGARRVHLGRVPAPAARPAPAKAKPAKRQPKPKPKPKPLKPKAQRQPPSESAQAHSHASPEPPSGAANPGVTAAQLEELVSRHRWEEVIALTADGARFTVGEWCHARAQAFEGLGDLWSAAAWFAGACAAGVSAAADALDRAAANAPDDATPLDAPLLEVFNVLASERRAFGRALAQLAERACARREELAFFGAHTLSLEPEGGDLDRAADLLDVAAQRFGSCSTLWFTRYLVLRRLRQTDESMVAYRRGIELVRRVGDDTAEGSFERYALRAKDNVLSSRGLAAILVCSHHKAWKRFDEVACVATEVLESAVPSSDDDREILSIALAEALGAIGRPREAATTLREVFAVRSRVKLHASFASAAYRGHLAGHLVAAGDLDDAVEAFATLVGEDEAMARELWERDPRFSGEPRFAVVLTGMTAPATRDLVEAQLAKAKKLLRRGKYDEASEVATLAVAGAHLLGDRLLLASALFLHARTLSVTFAMPGVRVAPLERALPLAAEDPVLQAEIEAHLATQRR